MTTPFYLTLLDLRNQLSIYGHRLVLAESCTAGLVAAEIGQIPGISEFFCGSMVVYRNPTKTSWLGIEPSILDNPQIGSVSSQVTEQLLFGLFKATPEATISAAITGHLGPNSPPEFDGIVFCAVGMRFGSVPKLVFASQDRLLSPPPIHENDFQGRHRRQREAAGMLLSSIIRTLKDKGNGESR